MNGDMIDARFFEEMYAARPDPWNFAANAYENARYGSVMRALRGRRYRRAFEPGCSVGVLTGQLGRDTANTVEAIDISPSAVRQARERCADLPGVTISVGSLPAELPRGGFDLVVLSEIGYYFTRDVLAAWAGQLVTQIESGGTLLASHWLGSSPDHVLSGDAVHQVLRALPGLRLESAERQPDAEHGGFRLDRWVRA